MSKLIDLTGQRVGRLTVICREGTYQRPSGNKEPTWRCKCDCGNEVVVLSSNLKKKNTLSCGCLQTENRYGARRETEYEIRDEVAYVKTFEGENFVVSLCDLDMVIAHRWRINANGYVADEKGNTIHRVLMNPPNAMDIHHINENKLDNRRSNLLMLTRSEHTSLHNRNNIANGVTVQEGKPLEAFLHPIDAYKGLKAKYLVFKADTGEQVENCFVLRPDKDLAAVAALRAYAEATDNDTLVDDIYNWVGKGGSVQKWIPEPPKEGEGW